MNNDKTSYVHAHVSLSTPLSHDVTHVLFRHQHSITTKYTTAEKERYIPARYYYYYHYSTTWPKQHQH